MRILLDLQGCQTESRFRGIGRYSLAFAQAIAKNAGQHEIWVLLNNRLPGSIDEIRANFKGLVPNDRFVFLDVPASVSWETPSNIWRRRAAELIRESFISELRPDIVHVSSLFEGAKLCDAVLSIGTFESCIPTAVTLYDLIPLLNPGSYLGAGWVRKWYMDKVENLKRADLLLAISGHSRQEAMDALDIEGERVVNISSAHADIFRPHSYDEVDTRVLYSRYGITLPYLMYNGALELRKNLDRLMQAFSMLPVELRDRYQLLFVGKVSDLDRLRLEHLAENLGIKENFVLTGHVSDDDLVVLFNRCELFVFPSLHEGFGLPALEAMACGAPTIGSNVTSIPEVIGRADALFDPHDPNDIATKIINVLTDKDLRQSLCEHALVQAEKFSWDSCAKLAIYTFEQLHKNRQVEKSFEWSVISAEREHGYRRLIDALANIPRQPIAPTDADLMEAADCIAGNQLQTDRIARACELPENMIWRLEGPFDSSYSLALLNRETARALDAMGYRVILHSTDGLGDMPPTAAFLKKNPDIARLYALNQKFLSSDADVTSRNLYPPRVTDMNCRINLMHHYAWEETGFPQEWVENFNEHLQGMTCLSRHVEKIMIDHGVTVPMSVSGCGVDHWERINSDKNFRLEGRLFRFLHVSSCFPRKGADLLLKAYGRMFTRDDDVTLVIKTLPNPHNEIHRWLAEARVERCDFPDVLIIEDDLNDSQLKSLYEQCHVLVAPSRAEGFGLPMAEAMLSGLAVITTGWGGQLDFCKEETAWLVDYEFEPAQTHFGLFDSVWAEPDIEHLARTMRLVYEMPSESRNERSRKGRRLLLESFSWSETTSRLVDSAREWAGMPVTPLPRIGWVTTWNTPCGIATYSAHLVRNMPADVMILAARTGQLTQADEPAVLRCWDAGEGAMLHELGGQIDACQIDTLVIQFNYGFFNFEHFFSFLNHQLDAGRKVVVMMHSTSDPLHVLPHKKLEKIGEALARCHRILVHTSGDLNRLKALGLVDNAALFPHGVRDFMPTLSDDSQNLSPENNNCLMLASYGFFLPHKGLLELIEVVALLHQAGQMVRLHMVNAEYPVPESAALIQQAREKISALGLDDWIQLTTSFLPDDESLSLLARSNLIIFPYQNTGESSSAAVRNGLAAGRPVAVTPLSIFDDVSPAVYKLPGNTPDQIAYGINQILLEIANESVNVLEKEAEAARWRESHRYARLGHRLYGMIQALARQN